MSPLVRIGDPVAGARGTPPASVCASQDVPTPAEAPVESTARMVTRVASALSAASSRTLIMQAEMLLQITATVSSSPAMREIAAAAYQMEMDARREIASARVEGEADGRQWLA